jgi:hypothetical protein
MVGTFTLNMQERIPLEKAVELPLLLLPKFPPSLG